MDNYIYKVATKIGNEGFSIAGKCVPWNEAERITGPGCRREIPRIMKELGASKVLVVTDSYLGEHVAPEIMEIMKEQGVDTVLYDGVKPNPTSDIVYEIRGIYEEQGCDGFLAIGGGGPIDAAKAAGCLAVRPHAKLNNLAGVLKVLHKLPPFLAVPTTSGTGSETTMAAVITDSETHHKYPIMDPLIIPKVAVLDPELLVSLPPGLTATTGMDVLTHAVESYLSWTNQTQKSEDYAEEATLEVFEYLERAYNHPDDLEAREKMMDAAFKAGWSFGRTGVGNVHAIAHTLGGLYNTPHGLANAVILPIVLEDYGKAVYDKLAKLAILTGVKTDGTPEEKAKAFIAEVYAMNERMGIPRKLEIHEEDIPQMIKWAMHECNPIYPVPVTYDAARFRRVIDRIRL